MKFKQPKIKIRKFWGSLNPVTRVIPNVKLYSRKNKNWKNWD